MEDFDVVELAWSDGPAVAAAAALIATAFADPERYAPERITAELQPTPSPLERQFFVAYRHGYLVGAAGLKAADWASGTHILYLSAVAADCRGLGIGRALVRARLDWLRQRFASGRVLVSTSKPKRFRSLGFRRVNRAGATGRHLMFLEYP